MLNDIEKSKRFVAEVVKSFDESPKILFCFFASPREDWEERFDTFKSGFLDWSPNGVVPVFELALPDVFVDQCRSADVIYIHGGDDYLLRYWMKQFDIPKIWQGKTVATNSAGSSLLSESSWTCDWRKCIDSFGVLPIKFIPHYNSSFGVNDPRGPIDWQAAKDELANYGDKSLPIYALEEADYAVFNV